MPDNVVIGHYRPFCKQFMYFDKDFNARTYQNKRLFPNKDLSNVIISVSGIGGTVPFSILIINNVSDLGLISAGQCFPLYFYEENNTQQGNLFDSNENKYIRRDAVSDFILERAKKQYGKNVTKEDIFYYVYGFLHSPKYRETFAADLKKMLPRLPLVEDVRDFWAFSKAGRMLAELHLNYEGNGEQGIGNGVITIFDGTPQSTADIAETIHSPYPDPYAFYKVEQMRFPKGQKAKDRPDTIIYNSRIRIENIPAEAYEYVVNGKSAIEWIMERYAVTVHKESGIRNDPNDWALEVGNPRYILDLLLSVINVSVQTVEVVKELPEVEF
jgi:predicted helicase